MLESHTWRGAKPHHKMKRKENKNNKSKTIIVYI